MAIIDKSFMLKKIEKNESIYVLYSALTHCPFVECDPETFDDQVYIFTTKEMTQAFAHPYTLDKYLMQAVKVDKGMIMPFLRTLYLYGVNAVMYQEEGAPIRIQLSDLVEKPDIDALRNDKIPRANPELQLTALYFMQELTRPIEHNQEEKKHLHDLEEEMAHNLFRSRFIISFDVSEIEGKWDPTDKNQKVKVPLVKTKAGKTFQPIYTDFGEVQKFNQRNKGVKLELTPITYDRIPGFLVKESEGFVFNPAGFNLVLTGDQIRQMAERYGEKIGE